MIKKIDNIFAGVIIGFLVPFIIFSVNIIYYINAGTTSVLFSENYTLWDFIDGGLTSKSLVPNLILAAICNLLPFFLFIKYKNDNTNKGIIASTVVIVAFIYTYNYFL